MRRRLRIVLAAAVLAAGCAAPAARPGAPAAVRIEHAWARRAPAMAHGAPGGHGASHGAGTGAVYVTIVNSGPGPDALIAAATDAAAAVELHETVQTGDVMTMRPVPRLEVPGGGRLDMRPGGYHLMLLGLTRDLAPGDTVRLTLTFERAGRVSVDAPVR